MEDPLPRIAIPLADEDLGFAAALKARSLSVTRPRLQTYLHIREHGSSTIQDIITALTPIDRASIYRVLALFRQHAIIQDVVIGGQRKVELLKQFSGTHQHHLSCSDCGQVATFGSTQLEQTIQTVARLHGFAEAGHQIEIRGRCADCRS